MNSLTEEEIDSILHEKRKAQKRASYHKNKHKVKEDPEKYARRLETNRNSWHKHKDKYNEKRRKQVQ